MSWKLETQKRLKSDAPKAGWWEFRQNNSGGSFDPDGGKYTIVWAVGPREADRIAQENDIYFDGCRSGRDCPCCGDRWSEIWGDDPDYDDMPVDALVVKLTTTPPVDPHWPLTAKSELDHAAQWGLGIRIIDKNGDTHWLRKEPTP